MAERRVAVWKRHSPRRERHRRIFARILVIAAGLVGMVTGISAAAHGWWPTLLDWAVVAIPAIAGFVAWVIPLKKTTTFHRVWLFVGGSVFSALIYLQQWETGVAHKKEMATLATKDDIAKLPTVQQIGLEFKKLTTEQSRSAAPKELPVRRTLTESKGSIAQASAKPTEQIAKGIDEIKRMLGSQQWGLSAEELVTLARRMAPFAGLVNAWAPTGGDLVTSILGNPESNRVANSLIAALRSAGWHLPGSGMSLAVFSGTPEGIIVLLHSKEDANLPVINQFVATLKESGVPCHGELRDDVPAGQFRIVVGASESIHLPKHYEVSHT